MKTYAYKLQRFKKNKILHEKINAAGVIWNYLVRIQQRHRSLFYPQGAKEPPEKWAATLEKIKENKSKHKYPGAPYSMYRVYNRLQRRRQRGNSKLGKTLKELHTTAIQYITQRIQTAFKLFFTNLKSGRHNIEPVKTKDPRYYPSFTLEHTGFIFNWDRQEVSFMKQKYKFHKDRVPIGKLKTLTVKRDNLGDMWLYVVSDENDEAKTRDPRPVVGIDVWLDPVLTLSDGTEYTIPMFYKEKMEALRKLDKGLSKKRECKKERDKETGEQTPYSGQYQKLRLQRARLFRDIVNKRREHHIQLTRELAQKYGTIAVPNVPIQRLRHRSGLKLNDLGYSMFLSWLEQQCLKTGTTLIKIPGHRAMVMTCHKCGYVLGNPPKKTWTCPGCNAVHRRELNVAKNVEANALNLCEQGGDKI
jgi:putative transposase